MFMKDISSLINCFITNNIAEQKDHIDPNHYKQYPIEAIDMMIAIFGKEAVRQAPLTRLCMNYIANGVKAYIMGKDIGANLINMIKKTNRNRMDDEFKVFNKELSKIEIRVSEALKCSLGEARNSSQYETYSDKMMAIEILSEGLTTATQVIKRIEAVFSDDNRRGICLSTIHKSKGLEADNVFILCPDKMHNKRAMQIEWMAQQEYNLEYVAYTRAKHYLGFITDFEA